MMNQKVKIQHLDEDLKPAETIGTLIELITNEDGTSEIGVWVNDVEERIDFGLISKMEIV